MASNTGGSTYINASRMHRTRRTTPRKKRKSLPSSNARKIAAPGNGSTMSWGKHGGDRHGEISQKTGTTKVHCWNILLRKQSKKQSSPTSTVSASFWLMWHLYAPETSEAGSDTTSPQGLPRLFSMAITSFPLTLITPFYGKPMVRGGMRTMRGGKTWESWSPSRMAPLQQLSTSPLQPPQKPSAR